MILLLVVAVGAIYWCFKDTIQSGLSKTLSNEKVTSVINTDSKTTTSTATAKVEDGSYSVGDIVALDGFQIKLSKALLCQRKYDKEKYYLALVFDIDNHSDRNVHVSESGSFEAYCDDYSLGFPYFGGTLLPETEGMNSLSGEVAPGKKMNGVTVYEISKDFSKFEIYFCDSSLSLDKTMFTITRNDVDDSVKKRTIFKHTRLQLPNYLNIVLSTYILRDFLWNSNLWNLNLTPGTIDTQSSFSDWLNNQNVQNKLEFSWNY